MSISVNYWNRGGLGGGDYRYCFSLSSLCEESRKMIKPLYQVTVIIKVFQGQNYVQRHLQGLCYNFNMVACCTSHD